MNVPTAALSPPEIACTALFHGCDPLFLSRHVRFPSGDSLPYVLFRQVPAESDLTGSSAL